ncbi:MAG TPA: protein kinase, partial [Anaerolineales bacterium]
LDHPGIVKVFTVNTQSDMLYIVMEYIPGADLQQLLEDLKKRNKWVPLNEALHVVEQLCETLDYAHRNKVLHRDIKPSNLMLKREPTKGAPFRVVMTDLGLAKLLEGQGLTQEKVTLGTPAYMSPEQASGRPTDVRSDVYSLGILLYELATGRLPFPIRTITEAARYHTQEPPPKPRSIRPDLPEVLEQVILKAIEKEPQNRYATAALLGAAVAEISTHSTEVVEPGSGDGNSLITVYDHSLAAPVSPPKPRGANPQTMYDDGQLRHRGSSVFAGISISPSAQARIQVVIKGKPPQIFPLPQGTLTIGRGPQNDIVLPDPKASQRHAQVTWDGMEYYVTDLSSRNGTFLAGTKLLPGNSEVWQMNQNLRIGDTWLRLLRPTPGLGTQGGGGSLVASKMGASALFKSSGAGQVGVSINPQQLKVDAGGTATGTLALVNQGPKVDHFTLSMTGIPSSWVATLPSSVQLMPGTQTEVVFVLQVPRVSQSRAGQHPITLRVTSQSDPGQFVEARLVLTVAPYTQFSTDLQPPRFRFGQKTRLTIANQGNANQIFIVNMTDREEALNFRVTPQELPIPEGQAGVVEISAALRKPVWIGGETIYPVTAEITTANADPQTQPAEVVGRAILPRWVLLVIPFLCVIFGLLGMQLYGNVTDYRQTRTATAQTATAFNLGLTATATWLAADDDRDGLTNDEELDLKTFPGDRDTDKDGLDDGQEVTVNLTNPLFPDTDGDGLKDGDEVSRGLDPKKTDTDGDGVPDSRDNTPGETATPLPSPTTQPPSSTVQPPAPPIVTTAVPPTSTHTPTLTQVPPPTAYANDFEGPVGPEWSRSVPTRAPSGRNFLGQFGNDTVVLSLNTSGPHSSVTLKFHLYVIGSWAGNKSDPHDVWALEILGGRKLLTTTFCNDDPATDPDCQYFPGPNDGNAQFPPRQGAAENNLLGYADGDAVYLIEREFEHSASSLVIIFSASGLDVTTNASWGLDNLEVTFE